MLDVNVGGAKKLSLRAHLDRVWLFVWLFQIHPDMEEGGVMLCHVVLWCVVCMCGSHPNLFWMPVYIFRYT